MNDEEKQVDVTEGLNGVINDVINNVNVESVGSNQRKQEIEALEKFYKLKLEEDKARDEYYNNQEKRKNDLESEAKRLEMELKMHTDKMQIELKRLELDEKNMKRDLRLRESQAKTEVQKMWIEAIKAGAAFGGWVCMSLAVMKFEETGTIRSKAFTGIIPKLKFW